MSFKTTSLPKDVQHIICDKATEYPFTGAYNDLQKHGTYLCRRCGLALFRSEHKFHSACGWPSFEAEIAQAVKRLPDSDGKRIEIVCARCDAHLGHVFEGEGFTKLNLRHCVNSLSLDFVEDLEVIDTEEAIFAAGCFWGVEYYFKKLAGVVKTEVGYTGGNKDQPTYNEVCAGLTHHLEAVRVIYNPKVVDYESVVKFFFEIHNPCQIDGQGPDYGEQYASAIFCYNEQQDKIARLVMALLQNRGLAIATKILPVSTFWPAEEYHQNYYQKHGKEPYCHKKA